MQARMPTTVQPTSLKLIQPTPKDALKPAKSSSSDAPTTSFTSELEKARPKRESKSERSDRTTASAPKKSSKPARAKRAETKQQPDTKPDDPPKAAEAGEELAPAKSAAPEAGDSTVPAE